jgi:hypothetical protein
MTLPPPTAVGSRISCHEDNAHAVRCAGAETAALTSLTQPAPPTDRSALRPILQWLIDQSRNAIEGGIGVGGVAALLTEDDPAFTELIRSLLVQHRKALADVVRDPTVTHPCARTWTWRPCWTASLVPTSPSGDAAARSLPNGPTESWRPYGPHWRPRAASGRHR